MISCTANRAIFVIRDCLIHHWLVDRLHIHLLLRRLSCDKLLILNRHKHNMRLILFGCTQSQYQQYKADEATDCGTH